MVIMHSMHGALLHGADLNLLVLLRALLRERHVTRAARSVGLSQSAASHALSRLRQLYGDPLLVRRGRALEPTPRALLLAPELEQGLSQLEGTLRQLPFDAQQARRRFTIAAADYFQALLGGLMQGLRSQAPGFELRFVSFASSLPLLDTGEVDFAMSPAGPLPPGLRSSRLYGDGFVCILRKRHPLKPAGRLSLQQYLAAEHLVVAPGGSPGSFVDDELSRRGLQRRVTATVSSFLAAPAVVSESNLISTGPEGLWRRLAPLYQLKLSPVPLRVPRFEIDLVWHARRDADPAHLFLREALARAALESWPRRASRD